MNKDNLPETLHAAIKHFSTLKRCHDFLAAMRWPDGVRCAHCGSDKVGTFSGKRMVSNCKSCKKQFSIKNGTIFEDSPLPLVKWLPAVWMIVNDKNGISSYELHRGLGVTQKTAWFMLHRIRLAMQSGSISMLRGNVEVDESFIGAKARNIHHGKRKAKGRGPVAMTAVQGLLQRKTRKGCSQVIVMPVSRRTKTVLQANVRDLVAKGANVFTDQLLSYDGLNEDFNHQVVNHAQEYVRGNVHTNGLENFWSLLKRAIKGTYVNVEPFHLFRYLDEQAFRFNERKDKDGDKGRFLTAISGIIGKGLTYASLTGKDAQADGLPC